MKYIHIRNLEKYQDGYKDRRHSRAKIWIDLVQGDPQAEILDEIDFSRLIKFIVLETCTRKETPLLESFLIRKGFDLKVKSLHETLKNISHFIEITDVTENKQNRNETVTESSPREEKIREEKIREYCPNFDFVWNKYPSRVGKKQAEKHFKASVKTENDYKSCLDALEKYKAHLAVNTWKIPQNGATWFNNWQDWINWQEPKGFGDGKSAADRAIEAIRSVKTD